MTPTPAHRVISDAVADATAAVIAAAIAEELPMADGHDTERAATRAVRDLRRLGWHITALPTNQPPDNQE